ncbi:MAG: hypothetical protein ACRC6V_03905 [Bacteroidales bacterium]
MLARARTIEKRLPVKANVVATSCSGCNSRVTPKGWINVCPICHAQSDPKPIPHTGAPNCQSGCARLAK